MWNLTIPKKLTAAGYSSYGGGGGGGINNKTKVINGVVVQTTGFPLNKTALEIALGNPKNVSSISSTFNAGGGVSRGETGGVLFAGFPNPPLSTPYLLPPLPDSFSPTLISTGRRRLQQKQEYLHVWCPRGGPRRQANTAPYRKEKYFFEHRWRRRLRGRHCDYVGDAVRGVHFSGDGERESTLSSH